jgi:cytochrome P450
VAARLRAELSGVLGGRGPTTADLPALPYLGQVVRETLRLYPPGWLFDREPVADLEFGGYPIRRGTILMFSPWVVHRDPRRWDRPEQFRPERFAAGIEIPPKAYAPFGDGPRRCVGNRFAEAEIALVLAAMLPLVDLELPPGAVAVPAGEATLRPRGGLRVTVRRRE